MAENPFNPNQKSCRLQVQERMTTEIAGLLDEQLKPRAVVVLVEGQHLCAMMRGVKKSETSMTTSAYLGDFKSDRDLCADFIAQVAIDRSA